LRAIREGTGRERRYADHIIFIYSDIIQNAPFCSQIFEIFFASGGKGALIPLTKILQMFLCGTVVELNLEAVEVNE